MKRWAMPAAGVLGLLLTLSPASGAEKQPTCGDFGTKIEFMDSPREAAEWAKKEQKLVLILHVSGNFEDPGLT